MERHWERRRKQIDFYSSAICICLVKRYCVELVVIMYFLFVCESFFSLCYQMTEEFEIKYY